MADKMKTRKQLVWWIYAVVAVHLVVGILLPLISGTAIFSAYNDGITRYFFGAAAPLAAKPMQIWWMSLFGPTVQAASIWMLALAIMGDQQRNAFAWAMLILGLVVWAPQDMFISAQARCWSNVAIDVIAVALMLPPLLWLCRTDLKAAKEHGK